MLEINSMAGATNATMGGGNLGVNQLATLSFPIGINILDFIGPVVNTTNATNSADSNVGIVFVVYDQNTLFPVRRSQRVEDTDNDGVDEVILSTVGSSVVSLTIAGLRQNTILPQPIEIVLRLTTTEVLEYTVLY